jgi:hypothetical protein
MNQTLAYLGLALFIALPPAVLLARYRLGRSMPWWVVLLIIAGGGWLLVSFASYFYGEYMCEIVRGALDPTGEALARCTKDGARNVFALLFGWLYGPLYSIPYILLFALARMLARSATGRIVE